MFSKYKVSSKSSKEKHEILSEKEVYTLLKGIIESQEMLR
jgi:hypothetical protein